MTLIEDLIDSEALEEGQKLPPERDLALMLGVSRPALREAVKTLEAHQRLVVKHGQGVFVGLNKVNLVRQRLLNLEVSLMELFSMRRVLESTAAAWAASTATDMEVEQLEKVILEQERAYLEPDDLEQLKSVDAAFHQTVVTMAKNRFLTQTFEVLQEMIGEGMETTLRVPDRLKISRIDHRRIFDAIRDHDAEAAAAAAEGHIDGAREAAQRLLGQHL
ncbi:MAG: FadR family transcriptional regulator [Acidobacteriota bacterium]|nr:FadR family transcriptional regulator [Acidobacteriota bacterium]